MRVYFLQLFDLGTPKASNCNQMLRRLFTHKFSDLMNSNQNLPGGLITILHVENLKRKRCYSLDQCILETRFFVCLLWGDGKGGFVHYILHLDIYIFSESAHQAHSIEDVILICFQIFFRVREGKRNSAPQNQLRNLAFKKNHNKLSFAMISFGLQRF